MSFQARRLGASMNRIDARLLRIIAVAGANYLGRFGSGLVVLITLPMARQSLPADLFGVWMMLSALLAFMAFADLGIGNGVLNRVNRAQAAGDHEDLRRTLIAGYVCTGVVGSALLAAWLIWSCLASEPTVVAGAAIEPVHRGEVLEALTTFVAVLAVNIPASLVQRVQLGMQQGYWNGIAQFCGAVVTLLAVPLTLHHGGGVAALVIATLGIQAGVNILNTIIWLWRKKLLGPALWRGAWDLPTAHDLLRSGTLFFLLQLAAAFAFQSDAIVITQILGQVAYGDFALVQKLFLFVSMLLSATMAGLWPAFGDALAHQEIAWAKKALRRGVATAAIISIASVTVLSLAMPWILAHWLHTTVLLPWSLVAALSIWTVIDAISAVLAAFMNGANILRAQLVFAVTMALAAFGAKWILTPILGAAGSVLATILAYCLISVPGQIYIFKHALKRKDY